jgi:6-phosphogluconolactonase
MAISVRQGLGTVALAALLAGCSASGQQTQFGPSGPIHQNATRSDPDSQTRLTERTPGGGSEFAYVTNYGDGTVSAYTINARSGKLQPVTGSPFGAGNQPAAVAIDPEGSFAYVANEDPYSGSVSAYTINSKTGVLTPVAGSPFAAGVEPFAVAVEPKGRFVYVVNYRYGDVSAFAINRTTGALTPVPGSPFAAGTNADGIAADPKGNFVYVSIGGAGSQGAVAAYKINARRGKLTPLAGSPFLAGNYSNGVAVDPEGKFAYVVNLGSYNVSAYTINATTGALTPVAGSPFAAGTLPNAVTVNPTDKFAYVVNGGSGSLNGSVSAYTINATTGALSPVGGSPFGAGSYSRDIAADAKSKFAYVTNNNSTGVSGYTVDPTSGALTPMAGSPFSAGNNPFGMATCRVKNGRCKPPKL